MSKKIDTREKKDKKSIYFYIKMYNIEKYIYMNMCMIGVYYRERGLFHVSLESMYV